MPIHLYLFWMLTYWDLTEAHEICFYEPKQVYFNCGVNSQMGQVTGERRLWFELQPHFDQR